MPPDVSHALMLPVINVGRVLALYFLDVKMREISRLTMPTLNLAELLSLSLKGDSVRPKSSLFKKWKTNLGVLACVGFVSGCALSNSSIAEADNLPSRSLGIDDFNYVGAFALPDETFGDSSANWAEGVIEVNGDSLFFVGHSHQNAIAEFKIPPLVNSQSIADLRKAGPPEQVFIKLLDKVSGGNPEALDRIVGLELVNGRLIANAIEYYDAAADNTLTTFAVEDASAMADSAISGFFAINGNARAAGWLSSVPVEWQQALGCTHITGHSSGTPILSRHSVGPSAFCVNLGDVNSQAPRKRIETRELLGFKLSQPLDDDLYNERGGNNLWTHLSHARFGFIVPGTSTYATFGSSGGHRLGIGYKTDRGADGKCHGSCASDPADVYNYYWLWDMQDLLRVKNGRLPGSAVRPYASGIFNVPFQTDKFLNPIVGGSYDSQTGILYLSVRNANNTLGEYANPPIIVGYRINAQ